MCLFPNLWPFRKNDQACVSKTINSDKGYRVSNKKIEGIDISTYNLPALVTTLPKEIIEADKQSGKDSGTRTPGARARSPRPTSTTARSQSTPPHSSQVGAASQPHVSSTTPPPHQLTPSENSRIPPEDETVSPKNNAKKPDAEQTFWQKDNLYIFIGAGVLLVPPVIYAGYKITNRGGS